jgi:hypothetical protein
MRDLKGVGPGTIFRPAIFGDNPDYGVVGLSPAALSFRIGHPRGLTLSDVRQSRRPRQTCWRADFQREADDPHDVFRITLTHDRSPFHVQPVDPVIVVDDTEIDR